MFNFFNKRKKYKDYSFNPDEIFLDTLNVSNLNKQQFEGVMKKPISPFAIYIFVGFCFLVFLVFSGKLIQLQLLNTQKYKKISEDNSLREKVLFAERGVIYDRNLNELAWNEEVEGGTQDFLKRVYSEAKGFGHLLGYVHYPEKDNNGYYWRDSISGVTGIEKRFDDILSGVNGAYLTEINALGETLSKGSVLDAELGENVQLTIDRDIQDLLYRAIENQAREASFVGGAGIIMDIHSGEILSLVSYPEVDTQTIADAVDKEKIQSYLDDTRKPFLNRAISGLYSPGSIVKPFIVLAALEKGVISSGTKILSTGDIKIPNPYNPSNPSIYKDWRSEGHGLTDLKFAIADSVNTFFYAISGGYENQKGIGIEYMKNFLSRFSFGKKTGIEFGVEAKGVIPGPEWKKELYNDDWRLGDTYITSIGQFGFQVSPIQVVESMAILANRGTKVVPHIVKDFKTEDVTVDVTGDIKKTYYDLVHAGMRDTVLVGTAQNLNFKELDLAVKTGTAQTGLKNSHYHSWLAGFFPYKKPQYAIVVVMERAPRGGQGSAARATREFFLSIFEKDPNYFNQL